MSRPCLSRLCLSRSCLSRSVSAKVSFCQHVLSMSTCPNMFCQHFLSTFHFKVFRQYVSCFVNMLCQHVLSICFDNMFCLHVLSTCFVNMFCQHVSIFLHFEQIFHKHLRQTTTTKLCLGLREQSSQSKIEIT